jgi:hypothetical protein
VPVKTYEQDLEAIMRTPHGRRFVWELLSRGGVFSTGFHYDPYVHAYNAGRRDITLALYEEVERVTPDLIAIARKEAHDRNTNSKPDTGSDAKPEPNPVADPDAFARAIADPEPYPEARRGTEAR